MLAMQKAMLTKTTEDYGLGLELIVGSIALYRRTRSRP